MGLFAMGTIGRNPRQMQLANALCRYLELANVIDAKKATDPQPQLKPQS
jgi:hypothetical protein